MFRLMRSSQYWLRVTVAVLTAALILSVSSVYWPVVVSLLLALILAPLCACFQKIALRVGWRSMPIDVAIILSFIVFGVVIGIVINHVFVPFIIQLNALLQNFSTLIQEVGMLPQAFQTSQAYIEIPPQVEAVINDTIVKIGNYTVDLVKQGISTVFNIAGTAVELFVVPIITFYFIKDGKTMVDGFIRIFPQEHQGQLQLMFSEIRSILSAYIRGQLAMSCIIAVITFAGMWALDVPYALVIAFLAAITEWIPIVGPIIGAIPAVTLGAVVSFPLAVKVLVFYIIVQQVDGHLIMPKVMGAVINLHPVVIVLALLMGGTLLGLTGMILAVPMTAILQILAKHMWYYNRYRHIRYQIKTGSDHNDERDYAEIKRSDQR